jgi:hypothetical protein
LKVKEIRRVRHPESLVPAASPKQWAFSANATCVPTGVFFSVAWALEKPRLK